MTLSAARTGLAGELSVADAEPLGCVVCERLPAPGARRLRKATVLGRRERAGARPGQGWSGGLLQILNSPFPVFLPEMVLTRNATTAERQKPSARLLSPWSHRS